MLSFDATNGKVESIHRDTLDIIPLPCFISDGTKIAWCNKAMHKLCNRALRLSESVIVNDLLKEVTGCTESTTEGNLKILVTDAKERLVKVSKLQIGETKHLFTLTLLSDSILRSLQHSSIFDSVLFKENTGVYAIDKEYNIIAVNEQAIQEFKKYINIDLSGVKNLKDVVSPKKMRHWEKSIFNDVFHGKSFSRTVEWDLDGKIFRNDYFPLFSLESAVTGLVEVSVDITEKEKRRRALEQSDNRFKKLIKQIPSGILVISDSGEIQFVSHRGLEIFGYSINEVKGKNILKFITEENHLKVAFIKAALESKIEVKEIFTAISKSGDLLQLAVVASLGESPDQGVNTQYVIAFQDITESSKLRKELDQTQFAYNTLFSKTNDAVIIYDLESSSIIECNDESYKYIDKSIPLNELDLQDIFLENYSILTSGYDYNLKFQNALKEIQLSLQEKSEIFVVKDVNDEERIVLIKFIISQESSSKLSLVIIDRTDGYLNDLRLKEQYEVYEKIYHKSEEGIDIVRFSLIENKLVNPELIFRNAKMKMLFNDEEGRLFVDPEEYRDIIVHDPSNEYDPIEVLRYKFVYLIKNGETSFEFIGESNRRRFVTDVNVKLIPVNDFVYMVRHVRDKTSESVKAKIISQQIEALNHKNEELKKYIESNLQLENFAYIASHDLKAPIRSVVSFAQLLRENIAKQIDEKNLSFLDIIITSSTNMQVLIDDLLAFSKINTQPVEFEKVNVNKLIKYLLLEISSTVKEVNASIKLDDLPTEVIADKTRIRQVFQNLVTNAIKFCKQGATPEIAIAYSQDATYHIFSVSDSGIGIEPQYLDEIFIMFKKLHSENKFKGTGIGLSICRKIVEQHNGSIAVRSKLGEGSTFTFSLAKDLHSM